MRLVRFASALLLSVAGLNACTSVPPSSYAQLAAMSPLDANPADIRMAVIAPEPLEIKPSGAILSIVWQPKSGEAVKRDFTLEVLAGNATAPKLASRLGPGRRIFVLKLTAVDAESLLDLQRQVRAAKAAGNDGRGQISAGLREACWNGPFPTGNEKMPLEAHLRTEAGGEWMALIQGIDLKDVLKSANIPSLPSC
ncbi:hypothetical protein [Rhizobium alvei]|uniref:Lipoprotein n=1 Tax=Rhizobium alvei TaxID=1132659 RepID=A0ABT8YN23_9HYPH|nr:hypothetical protein [Rhizobium alvei]MDO6965130.1 hypothetical protein [Rhizobium alvei]